MSDAIRSTARQRLDVGDTLEPGADEIEVQGPQGDVQGPGASSLVE